MVLILGFSIYHLIGNYKQNKGLLFGLLGILFLWIISKILATESLVATPKLLDQLQQNYGKEVPDLIKNVDASLYLTYFLLILAIGAIVYNSIIGLFRK